MRAPERSRTNKVQVISGNISPPITFYIQLKFVQTGANAQKRINADGEWLHEWRRMRATGKTEESDKCVGLALANLGIYVRSTQTTRRQRRRHRRRRCVEVSHADGIWGGERVGRSVGWLAGWFGR